MLVFSVNYSFSEENWCWLKKLVSDKKTAISVVAYINNLSIIVFILFFVKKSIQKPEKVSVYCETGKQKISPHSGILSWVWMFWYFCLKINYNP